jgi:hypothetical protein
MRELTVEESRQMAAQVGALHQRSFVLVKPRPGGRGDPAGDGAVAGQAEMALFADAFFDLPRDLHAAAILVRDDRRERPAVVVHGAPGRGHRRQADCFDPLYVRAQVGQGTGDGLEDLARTDLDAQAVVSGRKRRPCYGAGDLAIPENRGLD